MERRSHKRTRISSNFTPGGGSSYTQLPLEDDDVIFFKDGALRKLNTVAGTYRVSATPHIPITVPNSWATAVSWSPADNTDFALDSNGDWYDESVEAPVMEEAVGPKPKPKKSRVSRRPHVVWMESHRQDYLDEMCRWAGRGDFMSAKGCVDCMARGTNPPAEGLYRCEECFQPDLVCQGCCIRRHRVHPFHRIKKWSGDRFVEISLKDLGLKVQLNHSSMFCPVPIPCHNSMRVLHTNGIHDIAIQYCGCDRLIPTHLQLLRRRLYPASQIQVKTCATFELLDLLHKLALTTKNSTYDFYRALEWVTTGTGLRLPKSRYRALLRMCLQWRHLKLLKWGGRAHDPTGVAGTHPGHLGLFCPSCPWPGINLSENWMDAPPELRFLYVVILCMDANFRLKNNLVSNYSQDPGLGTGWAYVIARQSYERYVLSKASETDISTCVGFQALAKANTKNSKGLRTTGGGGVFCGRSEMLMPLGFGDLQKGERACNMDFIFGSAIQALLVPFLIISYDVCCQWFTNLHRRIETQWPDEIKPKAGTQLTPAIPKLHEPMHRSENHQIYSFNFIPGVGTTDGECPERFWAPHNALGNSTRTQGPGSRHDVLDDHFSFWNWSKYVGMGKTLSQRYRLAVADRNIQVEGHRGLSDALEPNKLVAWRERCERWEAAPFPKKNVENPFETADATLSEADVRKQLAEEEAKRLEEGGASYHSTSAWGFIQMGLELEEFQRRVSRLAKKTPEVPTANQESGLQEQRNNLRTRMRAWEQIAAVYMPGVVQYRANGGIPNPTPHQTSSPSSAQPPLDDSSSDQPESVELLLPSRIDFSQRTVVCRPGLVGLEDRLRTAQCLDALRSLRSTLKMKTRMIYFKNHNVRGQHQGTRSRAVIDRVHERARSAAQKYRAARSAKLSLVGGGEWETQLRVLHDGDVRGYQDPERFTAPRPRRGIREDGDDDVDVDMGGAERSALDTNEFLLNEVRDRRDGTGETRRTVSWIWKVRWSGGGDEEEEDEEEDGLLRVEWAKSRARANRSSEQVLMLKEEMRRTAETLGWKSRVWAQRAEAREVVDLVLKEGLQAYAAEQSDLQSELQNEFLRLWKAPLSQVETASEAQGDDDEDDDEDEDDIEGTEDRGGVVEEEDTAIRVPLVP